MAEEQVVPCFDVRHEGTHQLIVCQRCLSHWLRDTDDEVAELVERHIEEAKVALMG